MPFFVKRNVKQNSEYDVKMFFCMCDTTNCKTTTYLKSFDLTIFEQNYFHGHQRPLTEKLQILFQISLRIA